MSRIRKSGRAAIVICSRHFEVLARGQARVHDVPDLPLVLIDHPLGGIGVEQVHARLAQALPQVLALLRGMRSP